MEIRAEGTPRDLFYADRESPLEPPYLQIYPIIRRIEF